MLSSHYAIRNFLSNDFEKYVQFFTNIEKIGQETPELRPWIFKKKEKRPDYFLQKELFLVEHKKKVVGFADILPELKIGRVILSGFIHPLHRRKGLASELMKHVLKRVKELKIGIVHVCIHEHHTAAKHFLLKFTFTLVRHFLELEVDLSKITIPEHYSVSKEITSLRYGEESLLMDIQNKCFNGSWGFCPNNVEEIKYYLNLTDSSLKDVIVVKKEGALLGYCWTQVLGNKSQTFSQERGRIHMFGVHPDFRCKGLAKKLLLAALSYLKDKGIETVELTVDRDNTVALSLYNSIGFNTMSVRFWYEKILNPS